MNKKIKNLNEIEKILEKYKNKGEKIVHCHGVFDLLHPGHIRHFKEAKNIGDKLVVSVTPDQFVNKGPGRPAFNENLRLESIAALSFVDFVVLNDTADAVNAINHVKPNFYVKGKEYKKTSNDLTGKIIDESNAVEKVGGAIHFTDDIVFSSSNLINKYVDPLPENVKNFIKELKKDFSKDQIINMINDLKDLKVLIIGDAIIDEYQYVNLLGQTGKGQHLVACNQEKERFLGGSLIISNHIASFSDNVTLLTGIGKNCKNIKFINKKLDKNINFKPIYFENYPTLIKKRYVLKDGNHLSKLFETYSSNENLLSLENTKMACDFINKNSDNFDLILVADFGNGFMNKIMINEICRTKTFLAINTQINSGNRGYNVVTHYNRADYISLNEPEIRLAAHDRKSSLKEVCELVSNKLNCKKICVTKGVNGVNYFDNNIDEIVPAFASSTIDRVGAGDSLLALSSLCLAKKYPLKLASFIGSIASAMDVQIIGNKDSIKKDALLKFITRLFK
jgi:rfaE bifunctional protein nucleotidyltransferase chain/domain